ncbi:MAG: sugar ABC transporter substrate-binding protein [Candidatus Thiodiazotropha sp.]
MLADSLVASDGPKFVSAKNIGVLYWSMNIPGQVVMRQGLEAQAEEINRQAEARGEAGVSLTVRVAGDGPEGMERQIDQFYELVSLEPDAIIVQPTDNAALAGPLRDANRLGVPVIAYDQYISGGKLTAYVTSDNRQAGYLDGEYLASHFPDSHEIRLILVEYPHVSSTVERLNGFLDALRDYGQPFRILKTYIAVQPQEGRQAGQQILKDFPDRDSVDAIFTVNDGGGLSLVEELARAGRDEVVVASIDGDPASIENIRNGRLTQIDTAQFCGALGATAMNLAYDVVRGRSVPRLTLVPVFPVTRETLPLYPGWEGQIPEPFDKPWTAIEPLWSGELQENP